MTSKSSSEDDLDSGSNNDKEDSEYLPEAIQTPKRQPDKDQLMVYIPVATSDACRLQNKM